MEPSNLFYQVLQVSLRCNKVLGALDYSTCSKNGFLDLCKIPGLARGKLQGSKDMRRAEYHMGAGYARQSLLCH